MPTDLDTANVHPSIQSLIDKSLAGDASINEEMTLREHLGTCAACRLYQVTGLRAIASLNGFSFGKGPEAQDVMASVVARAGESNAAAGQQLHLWISCLLGTLLTIAGSISALRVVRLLAEIFPLPSAWNAERVHFGLMAFWVLPSIFICLLFLLLPNVSNVWQQKKGFSL